MWSQPGWVLTALAPVTGPCDLQEPPPALRPGREGRSGRRPCEPRLGFSSGPGAGKEQSPWQRCMAAARDRARTLPVSSITVLDLINIEATESRRINVKLFNKSSECRENT